MVDLNNFCIKIYSFMKKYNLKNVVWKEGGQYVAQCLNVEVSSFGSTKSEALLNLKEALELYFEDSHELNIQSVEKVEVAKISFPYA